MQLEQYPNLGNYLYVSNLSFPENKKLLLPSGFKDEEERDTFGVSSLAIVEHSLQEGQAHDALHDLWLVIQTFNYNCSWKKVNVHGQATNTCAQTFLKTLSNVKVSAAAQVRCLRR